MSKLLKALIDIHKEIESNAYMNDEEKADIRKMIDELTSFSGLKYLINSSRLMNLSAKIIAMWENAQSRGKKDKGENL